MRKDAITKIAIVGKAFSIIGLNIKLAFWSKPIYNPKKIQKSKTAQFNAKLLRRGKLDAFYFINFIIKQKIMKWNGKQQQQQQQ